MRIVLFFIVLAFLSCEAANDSWQQAQDHTFKYKVIRPEGASTESPTISYEDKVTMHYWVYNKDQLVISSTQQDTPISLILPGKMHRNQFEEPLTFAREGDSLVMKVAYKDALKELSSYANSFEQEDEATICYKILRVEKRADRLKAMQKQVASQQGYPSAAAMRQEQQQKRASAPKLLKQLQQEITQKKAGELTGLQSQGQLQYLLHKPSEGADIQAGDTVYIYYIAALEEKETIIDNLFENPNRYQLIVDQSSQIPKMMHLMVKQLKKGAAATFFVPADLAYGEKGSGQRIPPNSNLVFYMEIAELKKAR